MRADVLKDSIACYLVDLRGHVQSFPVEVFQYEDMASIMVRFSVEERLTREMVEAFVDRVEIFQDERVEIRWKFGEV